MKKLLSIFISIALVFSLAIPALADSINIDGDTLHAGGGGNVNMTLHSGETYTFQNCGVSILESNGSKHVDMTNGVSGILYAGSGAPVTLSSGNWNVTSYDQIYPFTVTVTAPVNNGTSSVNYTYKVSADCTSGTDDTSGLTGNTFFNVNITVLPAPVQTTPTITWSNPADITYGTALSDTQLNATASVAGTFAYTPSTGTVLEVGTHQLNVFFTSTDTALYTTASKTVSINVTKATPIITWSNPADIPYGTALSSTQLNADASVAGSFAYTPAAGIVLDVGTHQLSVSFTPDDQTNYTTAYKTVSINVTKATPTITWNPANITYGTALGDDQLNATASIAGSLAYTPAAGTVLDAGVQPLSVTFTPTDTAHYTPATKTVNLTVNKATPIITWNDPADITYGTALSDTKLNAAASWIVDGATVTVSGTFTYDPVAGTVLNAGVQTLSVSFTPDDTKNYNLAEKTVNLTVNKATPTITWNNPGNIIYGTALSDTQLNATASWIVNETPVTVLGTFTYDPPAGTVLNAGANQALSVSFTPGDQTNYTNPTDKTVYINVVYNHTDFLQPINAAGKKSVFKLGSTIPVKFQLTDVNGNYVSTAIANIQVLKLNKGTETVNEDLSNDPISKVTDGTLFRYDSTSNQYIYNLSTKSFAPGYDYKIIAVLDDGNSISTIIGVK